MALISVLAWWAIRYVERSSGYVNDDGRDTLPLLDERPISIVMQANAVRGCSVIREHSAYLIFGERMRLCQHLHTAIAFACLWIVAGGAILRSKDGVRAVVGVRQYAMHRAMNPLTRGSGLDIGNCAAAVGQHMIARCTARRIANR